MVMASHGQSRLKTLHAGIHKKPISESAFIVGAFTLLYDRLPLALSSLLLV